MASYPKNYDAIGILLLLFLAGNQSAGPLQNLRFPGSFRLPLNLSELGRTVQLERFARDMRRIANMMDQLSGLPRLSAAAPLPAPSQPSVPSLPQIDFSQLMELAGPFMAMLGASASDGKK